MGWYREGTVEVTAGSQNVIGTGTAWVENVRVGDAFQLNGVRHEVVHIASDSALSIYPPWQGSSGVRLSYHTEPLPSYNKLLAKRLALAVSDFERHALAALSGIYKIQDIPFAGAMQRLDAQAFNIFRLTLREPTTTLEVDMGDIAHDTVKQITIILYQGDGARLVKWPANIKWAYGLEPVLTFEPGGEDIVTLLCVGGRMYYGFSSGGGWR